MGAKLSMCEVRWERYPRVAESAHSRAWLRWQCNRGLAANTLEAYGRGLERNLLFLRGAVPGPQGGYLVITKAQKPPRERRGFAGAATVDPLKAAKRAAKKA